MHQPKTTPTLNAFPLRFFLQKTESNQKVDVQGERRWLRLFPFRKRSSFLTIDAIIGNQTFSQYRCNISSGLSYN